MSEREAICGAFVRLCAVEGYRNVSLEQVLDEAAVDAAGFHRHFADLEDCFAQNIAAVIEEILSAVGKAYVEAADWRSGIRAVAHAIYRFLAEDRIRGRFLVVEILSAGDASQLIRDKGFEAMYALIDLGRQERPESSAVSRATAESIGGSIYNQIYVGLVRDDLEGLRLSIPNLMYTVVLPYVGPEEALEELKLPPPARHES